MNPSTASMPAPPRAVNDITVPAPAPVAPIYPTPPASNVVANIPVHNPAGPGAVNEDAELDKIMHDVGREMKKDDKQPHRRRFLSFGGGSKAGYIAPVVPRPAAQPPAAAVQTQPRLQTAASAALKPGHQSTIPVFVIFVAFLVTGFLAAAAIAAYRQ